MAITRLQAGGSGHGGAGGFGAQTYTFANAVQNGSLLVCFYWGNSNTGNATCSDNVNGAWTALTQRTPIAGSGRRMNWFYKENSAAAAAGAMTVTITPAANAGNTEQMQCAEYAGAGSLIAGSETYAAQASSVTSFSLTTPAVAAGSLVLYGIVMDNDTGTNHTLTVGSNMTSMVFGAGNTTGGGTNGAFNGMAFAENLSSGSTSVARAITISSAEIGGKHAIAFTAAPAQNPTQFFETFLPA